MLWIAAVKGPSGSSSLISRPIEVRFEALQIAAIWEIVWEENVLNLHKQESQAWCYRE